MVARVYYTDNTGTTVEIPGRIRPENLRVTSNAEQGSVGSSSIIIDDPDGTFEINGHRLIFIQDDEAPATSGRTFLGFAAERNYSRMDPKVEDVRQIEVTVTDINTLLWRQVMVGTDCNRPAETDVARMTWLTGTTEAAFIDDLTYFSTGSPVAMDKVDYRGQMLQDIIYDCSQQSGKNYYLLEVWDGSEHITSLWYDFASSSAYPSTLRISNVLSDVDSAVTFAAGDDTKLERSPSRVFSGVYMPYDGGAVYRQRTSTGIAFARRDTISPQANVKTAAKARARADRYLETISTEEDTITTHIIVPNAQVNDVMAGMLIPARFSHFAPEGYADDFVGMRVLNRTVSRFSPTTYRIDLTLSTGAPPAATVGNFLIAFAAQGVSTQQLDLSTHGWTLAFYSGDFTTTSVIGCGAGPPTQEGVAMYYRAIVPGESATVATFKLGSTSIGGMWVYEIGGCDINGLTVVHDNTFQADGSTAAVNATAAVDSVLIGGIGFGKVNYDSGWAAGGLYSSAIVSTVSGTQLVNKSSLNNDSGAPCPWVYQGYHTGTGSLSVSAAANSHGAGGGAYACGYNVGKGGLLIPIVSSFSIVQSAFGGGVTSGDTYSVTLPAPPVT